MSTFFRLLGEHGSAQAALEALPEVAAGAGVRDYRACPPDVAVAELQAAARAGARMVCFGSPDYPPLLSEISDPPPFLWVRGEVSALARDCVALVGARNASSLGLRMARALSAGLGEAGLVVASGLARGIDTAAHRAALESGTLAVLAGGVDVIYPAENTTLADDILSKGGALVSEAPMGLQPQARHFPARNRIVSGVARGVVVVEAAAKSGSLITARAAAEQGREVMAVPGHPFDARAGGCNMLIRDGARLVRGADDVVEALPLADAPAPQRDLPLEMPEVPPERRSLRETADLHGQILARLGQAPLAEDQLIRDLAAPSGAVSPVLTDLELEGRIRRQPGGLLSLR